VTIIKKREGELIMHHAYNWNPRKEHMVPTLYWYLVNVTN
jgi:hypothetical protein